MSYSALKNCRPIIASKLFFEAVKLGFESLRTPKNIAESYSPRGFWFALTNFIITFGGLFSTYYTPPEQMLLLLGKIDKDKDLKALKTLLKDNAPFIVQRACLTLISDLENQNQEREQEINQLTRQLLKGTFKTEAEIINYYRVQTTNRYSLNTAEKTLNFYQEINNTLLNKNYISSLLQEDRTDIDNQKKQRIRKSVRELENHLKELLLEFDPNLREGLIEELRKAIILQGAQ